LDNSCHFSPPTLEELRTLNCPDGLQEADFSIDFAGDEMSPTIPSGSRVFLRRCSTPREGDIVLILHQGALLCRRLVGDPFGNVYLICDNPDFARDSITVRREDVGSMVCFGTVCAVQPPKT